MNFTLWNMLADRATGSGDRVWLVDKARTLTFAQAAHEAEAVAAWLHNRGIRRGDRIVVHMHKCFEETVAILAAARLGAVFVNIHPQWLTSGNSGSADHALPKLAALSALRERSPNDRSALPP